MTKLLEFQCVGWNANLRLLGSENDFNVMQHFAVVVKRLIQNGTVLRGGCILLIRMQKPMFFRCDIIKVANAN